MVGGTKDVGGTYGVPVPVICGGIVTIGAVVVPLRRCVSIVTEVHVFTSYGGGEVMTLTPLRLSAKQLPPVASLVAAPLDRPHAWSSFVFIELT